MNFGTDTSRMLSSADELARDNIDSSDFGNSDSGISKSKRTVRSRINIANRLTQMAARIPNRPAVVMPAGKRRGKYRYRSITFAELEDDSNRLAAGLVAYGMRPGARMVLMVRPSIDFVSLVFALFKAGGTTVLIDPGMGREHLLQCLEDVNPDGFVAVPAAQALRMYYRRRFPQATLNVTVGRRWFWSGPTAKLLRQTVVGNFRRVATAADDPAAIIFTTGSTGPPKGVLYEHGNFDAQVEEIRNRYDIQPGGVDLAGFPLFGLFNSAMGMTTIIPDMDASRPASVDPGNIVEHIRDWNVTQSFASPAVWNVVGRHCVENDIQLPTLRLVLSAGAPVPAAVLERMKRVISPDGEIYTPYGATESLPIASISASEVLEETASQTASGAGTCVGRKFNGAKWRVIKPTEGPIEEIAEAEKMPKGEIGELIVTGPMVTKQYVTRTETNALSKIRDGHRVWHRIGDVGYFDSEKRFWYCGRKSHRVMTAHGPMYTVRCEAIINELPEIYRTALIGIGPLGKQTPVLVCEPLREHWPHTNSDRERLIARIAEQAGKHSLTSSIDPSHIFLNPRLPVDIRHNSKIFREQIGSWVLEQLPHGSSIPSRTVSHEASAGPDCESASSQSSNESSDAASGTPRNGSSVANNGG